MNVQLPSELSDFIKGLVTAGHYQSEEAAFIEGIRLLQTQEQLRQKISKGVQQLDAGDWFDEETVFAEVKAEIDEASASGRER